MTAIATSGAQLPLTATTQQNAGAGQYLSFTLIGEIYALGILNIKEIIDYGNLTEIPMMPAFVRGVINLRGMAKRNGRFIILLNANRVLSVDEMAALSKAAAGDLEHDAG